MKSIIFLILLFVVGATILAASFLFKEIQAQIVGLINSLIGTTPGAPNAPVENASANGNAHAAPPGPSSSTKTAPPGFIGPSGPPQIIGPSGNPPNY